ncbi:pickpocket protein 28-like [Malaya genurostris]|uniref:pickpocket protein 28-like n=1 Tax=Malaya genurostris TaxID=325434 RepID=UPI0026F38BED|nr:pickpocket protein 28-like [Malaya genurostris]
MSAQNEGYLRRLWTEYCLGSSVYATRYLIKPHLSPGERLWWAFWLIGAIAACFLSIIVTIRHWTASPVYISYAKRLIPTWYIPFPAITICPLAQTRVEYFNLTDVHRRLHHNIILNESENAYFRAMAHICPSISMWHYFNESRQEDTWKVLQRIAIPMENIFSTCRLRNVKVPCSTIISQSITQFGICYTFNAISSDDMFKKENLQRDYDYSSANFKSDGWSLEDGYPLMAGPNIYPFRPIGVGKKSSLSLVLRTRKIDQDFHCNGPRSGYYISVHRPDEIPLFLNQYHRLSHLSLLSLIVKPELTLIANGLKSYHYKRRQCYFKDERELRYFKVYNYNNCLAECIANYSLHLCGCVPLAMPRSPGIRVCDASVIECFDEVTTDIFATYYQLNKTEDWQDPCQCLPDCTTLSYDVEMFRLPIDFDAFSKAVGNLHESLEGKDTSILHVGLKYKWLLPMQRREMMGFSDLLAHFGGLFALLMGASVISLLELVYFCLIRPCRNDSADDSVPVRQVLPWKP